MNLPSSVLKFVKENIYNKNIDIEPFITQECFLCKIIKPITDFTQIENRQQFKTNCKNCIDNAIQIQLLNQEKHQKFLQEVKALFDQKWGSRKIAKHLKCDRSTVQQAYKELGVYNSGRSMPRTAYLATEKCCKVCNIIKPVSEFRKRIKGDRISYEGYCLICEQIYVNVKNKERYYRDWDKRKEYRTNNRKRTNLKERENYNNNPIFKLRKRLSHQIRFYLKTNNSSKFNKSFLKYLPYALDQLKQYIEILFEPWMTWQNHGNYNRKTWDDNDPTTWTWQIDHIIPHSTFKYTSMDCQEFRDCWALSNLRPYSAKQNILDGTNRTRHTTNS